MQAPISLIAIVAVLIGSTSYSGLSAVAMELAPFKDRLFAYPGTLEVRDNGNYRVVDYHKARDIHQRDEVPERRVHPQFVETISRRYQRELSMDFGLHKLRYYAVGVAENARMITVFLHGKGGDRYLGVNDYNFGGNFNRIKNLMVRNGGLYLSPDLTDFSKTEADRVAAILAYHHSKSPNARIYLACGSMGGILCWHLANDTDIVSRLGGLLFLGSMWSNDIEKVTALRHKVPIFIGHGSSDTVFPIEAQENFYQRVLRQYPSYPLRFVRFETGSHGTPIRMTDWRETLNWMLSLR